MSKVLWLPVLISLICFYAFAEGQDEVLSAKIDGSLVRDFKLQVPVFSQESPWNQKITGLGVRENSLRQILTTYRVLKGDESRLNTPGQSPQWHIMDVTVFNWTIPIFRASDRKEEVLLCNYEGELDWSNLKVHPNQKAGGPVLAAIPAGRIRPSGPESTDSDGHLVLYNPKTKIEYDFWQATTHRAEKCGSRGGGLTGDKILEAGAVDYFDTRKMGINPANHYSARASGIPLLAGLILPEDIANGVIAHALGLAIPGPRNLNGDDPKQGVDFFYPIATAETDFYSTDPNALAQGQMIRLKKKFQNDDEEVVNESKLSPVTRMVIKALREYGAYIVDNAGGFTLYAEDIHTGWLDVPMAEVNRLIGMPAETPLPKGKTKWQRVATKLYVEIETLPIAVGPWKEGQDPKTAEISYSNFEVVK